MSSFAKKYLGAASPLRLSRRNTEEKKKAFFRWAQLPEDVMIYLLNFLDRRDLSALGRTSKFMRNQVNPVLYRTLPFYRRDKKEKNYQLCQLLVTEPLLASFVYNIEEFPARLERREIPRITIGINPFVDDSEDSQEGVSLEVLQTQAINNCINLESLSIYMG
ncbi:hypothetical protein FRC00_013932, partial [Tulasnella sp. 408]